MKYSWKIETIFDMRNVLIPKMPPRTIKSAKVVNEPVFINKDGEAEPYIPGTILTHRDAYSASLHVLFKHIADFHMLMIDVLAEKYNLDANEIIETIQGDPRYNEMKVDPKIESLLYFKEEDLAKKLGAMNISAVPVAPAPAAPVVEVAAVEATPPPKKRRVVVKKTVAATPPTDS